MTQRFDGAWIKEMLDEGKNPSDGIATFTVTEDRLRELFEAARAWDSLDMGTQPFQGSIPRSKFWLAVEKIDEVMGPLRYSQARQFLKELGIALEPLRHHEGEDRDD